jgi:hypothetical protein
VLIGVEVLSNFAQAKLCVDNEEQRQAPIVTYQVDDQTVVYTPLGQGDAKNVMQANVQGETWVLSAVKELGEDWEMRNVLDRVAAS